MHSLEVTEKESANEPSDKVLFNEEMTGNKKQQEIKAKEKIKKQFSYWRYIPICRQPSLGCSTRIKSIIV